MVDLQDVGLGAATTIITVLWSFLGYWFYTNLISSTQPITLIFWSIFLITWMIATTVLLKIVIEALVKTEPKETLEFTCFCEDCKKTVPVKKVRFTKTGYVLIWLECDHYTGFVFSGKLMPIEKMRKP